MVASRSSVAITITPEMHGTSTRCQTDQGAVWVVVGPLGNTEQVFLDKCSHMGNSIRSVPSGFMCDFHGWSYQVDGSNDISGNPPLEAVKFSQSGQVLFVSLVEKKELLPRSSARLNGTEKLELLAHACFKLSAGQSRILFDPWLFGDTYWGSWRHFPRTEISHDSIEDASAVVITHPHPDHFHPETLDFLPRTVPIYFPNFPSQIIPKVLTRMGFARLYASEWEEVIEVGDDISFAFLRPRSVWEDSAVLVRVKDWIWLNQNDAGAPLRDDLLPNSVDLFSSSFDVGASGYPLTWEMRSQKVDAILANSRSQLIANIGHRCQETRARYFAPFAGWWRHAFEEHQEFARRLPHTTMPELASTVEDVDTGFLMTLPGSEVDLKTMEVQNCDSALRALHEPWEVSRREDGNKDLCPEELVRALMVRLSKLASMSQAVDTERVEFTVHVAGTDISVVQSFGLSDSNSAISIRVEVDYDTAVLYALGDETVTWNHLDIGYWGRWKRNPDVYPTRFMRLLQLGYVPELQMLGPENCDQEAVWDASLGQIVESNPELASALLTRAGLPCLSCTHLKDETLRDALEIHSVPQEARSRLYSEVRALLANGAH